VGGSLGADVTGGMDAKVRQMLALTQRLPGMEAFLFSGEPENSLLQALQGQGRGTRICAK